MSEKCPKCDGKKRILNYYFYCPECDEEITKYERTSQGSKNTFNDIITYTCPKCGKEVSGVLNDLSFEERVSLCPCSQEALVRKLSVENRYIAGHLPKSFWNRCIKWYQTNTVLKEGGKYDSSKSTFYKENEQLISTIEKFTIKSPLLSIYRVFWLHGEIQSGVTSLAIILAKNIIGDSDKTLYFTTMYSFIEKSKDFEDRTYVQRILDHHIIIFDDCFSDGKFYLKSEFMKSQLYNFFKDAIVLNKIIICTSKIAIGAIPLEYGVIKRLLNVSACSWQMSGSLEAVLKAEKDQQKLYIEKAEKEKQNDKEQEIPVEVSEKETQEIPQNNSVRGPAIRGKK